MPQKDVFVNVLPGIIGITGLRSNGVGGSSTYTAYLTDVRVNVTSYNWTLLPGVYNNYFAPYGNKCDIAWYNAGSYVLSVNAQNNCPGSSNTYYFPIDIYSRSYMTLSPNPANDYVEVSVLKNQDVSSALETMLINSHDKSNNNEDLAASFIIKIFNSFGTLFYSTKKTGNTFTIPVTNLQNGTYTIEANDGKNSCSKQLMVKH